ncbi:MAG: serine acetyltransferase [Prevotella sp.]|nr:serine acetyltransferase [Prevotella sp.]
MQCVDAQQQRGQEEPRVAHVTYKASDHYNERVAEFEQLPAITSADIVMLGNSLTEFGGDWSERLGCDHVVNRGIIGDTSTGIYHRLCQILPGKPKAIFLLCGTNDVSHNLTPRQVFERCCRVIEKIRKDAPQTKLFVQSLVPINESFGRWKLLTGKTNHIPAINRLLKNYCKRRGITYIDLFPNFVEPGTNVLRRNYTTDGIHFSDDGYRVWATVLAPYVEIVE